MSAPHSASPQRTVRTAYLALASVIFAAAFGPIVIRFAQLSGAPSLVIISGRLTLSSLILLPFCLKNYRADFARLSGRDWLMTIVTGAIFAANLIALFVALEYTSVLVTGILRRTSSLWILLAELLALGVLITRNVKAGLVLTLIGTVLVAFAGADGITLGSDPILGALIALLGAIASAGYMIFGRILRKKLPFLAYSLVLFVSADIVVTLYAVLRGVTFFGYGWQALFWIVIVTIVTQFFGHIALSFCIRHFDATYISVMMNAAILFSGVIAFVQFGELPTPLQIMGSLLVLAGVIIANRKERALPTR